LGAGRAEGDGDADPRIALDRRYQYVHLLGTICTALDTDVVRMAGSANTESKGEFLLKLGAAAKLGAHVVLVPDGAGRRRAQGLAVPETSCSRSCRRTARNPI